MAFLALLLLAFVPLGVWRYARAHAPRHTWLAAGAAFGAVVSPLSSGLYSTYFVGPIGLPTGMLGLVSVLFHGPPGHRIALGLGLIPHDVVSGIGHIYVELINGAIWATVYGFLGLIVDRFRFVHSRKPA